jgi:hypothetical protein
MRSGGLRNWPLGAIVVAATVCCRPLICCECRASLQGWRAASGDETPH